jgi:hypothetical protein
VSDRQVWYNAQTEADFQKKITDLASLLNLKWHHETDSRKSPKGWPDLVISGPEHVLFVELKSEKGRVTAEQAEWLDALDRAGGNVYVWRPSMWDDIEKTLRRLAQAKGPGQYTGRWHINR